jgi:dihydrofolate synthase / folylpolyglutamate synthase
MHFDAALRYLLGLGHETLALKLGLTTTELVLNSLEDPQKAYPSVQIAGTNGKGSTAVMLDTICRAAGLRTGLFTSPHLINITERIRIEGREISQGDFAELATLVRGSAEHLVDDAQLSAPPTFFEQITAIALLAFAQARVDLAILETGLGGRLDSTTTARANTIGITPIALDHQEYLGETLEEIAGEKAAIIRPGVTAVIAAQPPAALAVILKHCAGAGVSPRLDGCRETITGATADGRMRVTFTTSEDRYEEVELGLRGRHQVTNATLAIQLAESLREKGFRIPRDAIVQGIEGAAHPGRLDLYEGQPQVLFDGAHNPAGANALGAYLDEFINQPITLVFGAMRDKRLEEMISCLFPRAQRLIITQPNNPRAASPQMIFEKIGGLIAPRLVTLESSPARAIDLAYKQTPGDGLICVTGSLYLIGELRQALAPGHIAKSCI